MDELKDRPAWLERALDPNTPTTEANESVRTTSIDGRLFPTIRMINGRLKRFDSVEQAYDYAVTAGDFIQFDSDEKATEFSKMLSKMIGKRRSIMSKGRRD